MELREIHISQLFGYFDHHIPMRTAERITIVHGPNGVGKTTILRLIQSLFRRQFTTLIETPFTTIKLGFDDDRTLEIIRLRPRTTKRVTSPASKLTFRYTHGNAPSDYDLELRSPDRIPGVSPSVVERSIPNLERVGPTVWYDRVTDQRLSLEELVYKYHHLLPNEVQRQLFKKMPDELTELLDSFNIIIVETQRLFSQSTPADPDPWARRRRDSPHQVTTVEKYSDDLVARIRMCHEKSAQISSRLDGTFPQRLLKKPFEALSEEDIRHQYQRQSEFRDRLLAAGLFAAQQVSLPSTKLEDHERRVLSIYLSDVKEKLGAFEPILQKVELFKEIVNSRFSYKQFSVDQESGFVFQSSHDQSRVPSRALSSGEQHEIVLTYQLLFEATPGSLIFIDEPELSLHVTWQRKFLDDIARISAMADLDFLIATHSPSIIHHRRHLMVELGSKGD
ncbi:MAG: AAA family ATPase [Gemmatimonadetes bacterium]|nr:AAA family ATPase [Gemmatimonadota bacterium]